MISFLKYRIPLYYTFIICFLFTFIAFIFVKQINIPLFDRTNNNAAPAATDYTNNSVDLKRLGGYNFIAPLMFVEKRSKSDKYAPLMQKIASYIDTKKAANEIVDASFYFKEVNTLDWTGYNEDKKYFPGSLMKVPVLLSYLRLAEKTPGLLEKQLFYKAPFNDGLDVTIVSKQLKPGQFYTVKELLRYMVSYSDNNATTLLDQNLDQNIFNKTLTDLGLAMPEKGARNYPISAKDYSLFMRAIYNASYLTITNSEYAAELLSTTEFKDGFAKGFPLSVKMIEKFGESGTTLEHHLSESGIVYVNNKPYVLTVMTKGKELSTLAATIADIANIVYQQVAAS